MPASGPAQCFDVETVPPGIANKLCCWVTPVLLPIIPGCFLTFTLIRLT